MPSVVPSLANAYSLFLTLRIVSIAVFVLLLPCLISVRPRLPELHVYDRFKASPITLRNRIWWTLVTANTFQALGFSYR